MGAINVETLRIKDKESKKEKQSFCYFIVLSKKLYFVYTH